MSNLASRRQVEPNPPCRGHAAKPFLQLTKPLTMLLWPCSGCGRREDPARPLPAAGELIPREAARQAHAPAASSHMRQPEPQRPLPLTLPSTVACAQASKAFPLPSPLTGTLPSPCLPQPLTPRQIRLLAAAPDAHYPANAAAAEEAVCNAGAGTTLREIEPPVSPRHGGQVLLPASCRPSNGGQF